MKALRVAVVAIALAFTSLPATAAVILTQNTSTWTVCVFDMRCVATAQIDFTFPTFDLLRPMFARGPTTDASVPPHYTYRIVISAPEAPLGTVAHTFHNYYGNDYVFFNGSFRSAGGEDWLRKDYRTCDLDGGCAPGGYVHNNQSIFTFEDGLIAWPAVITDYPYSNGYTLSSLGVWTEGASVAAFFDPALDGMPVTIQVFQYLTVPEPSSWALLILGFGFCGHMLRRLRSTGRSMSSQLTLRSSTPCRNLTEGKTMNRRLL